MRLPKLRPGNPNKMQFFDLINRLKAKALQFYSLPYRVDELQQALGRVEMRQLREQGSNDLQAREVKVSSQWGEDGIIQFLLEKLDVPNKVFVEFGIGDYRESNTRFLLRNNNWKGLVIDGSESNIAFVKQDQIFWQHNLSAECSFITRDNINQLISKNGIAGDIGLLSVDIDGNDYWVWEAIDCISPRIVICEYNSFFGSTAKVSTPYQNDFQIFKAHYSGLYWGASIGAFDFLARKKGYSLVGSNTAGNNIFFVRNDIVGKLKCYSARDAHVSSQFRIARDENGKLSFLDRSAGLELIGKMLLVSVDTLKTAPVDELIG